MSVDPAQPKHFSPGRSLLLASLIVGGLLLLAEAGLRLIGVAPPQRPRILLRSMDMDVSFPFMRPDRELFWSLEPGWRGAFQGRQVTIDSLGLRGAEPARPKPPGARRLACFGDSITFGFGLDDRDAYPQQLGARLAERRVEVLNAGTTGYTSHQVLGLLRRLAPSLQLDAALVLVGWNDGNARAMNDRLYAGRIARELALEQALDHVYLYRLFKGLYLRAQARSVRRGGAPATAAARAGDDTGRGARVPVAEYRENLAAIVAECRARGIRPALLPLPMRRPHPDPAFDSPYPAALADAARSLGVPLLDLGPLAYAEQGSDTDADFIDAIHWSAAGAALAARLIEPQLAQIGLP